jgi:hypothetical protein
MRDTPKSSRPRAIPLATMTASRVINLYDVMDSAYDAPEIKAKSLGLGHVPIIEAHPRSVLGRQRSDCRRGVGPAHGQLRTCRGGALQRAQRR